MLGEFGEQECLNQRHGGNPNIAALLRGGFLGTGGRRQTATQASLVRQRFMASSDYDNLDDLTQSAEVSIYLIIILTLALVLLIEGLRRKLDALAHGHQFFQTVLELIYREVTTLGIVEFCLYLVHKYSDAYGSQTEGEISGGVEDCHTF